MGKDLDLTGDELKFVPHFGIEWLHQRFSGKGDGENLEGVNLAFWHRFDEGHADHSPGSVRPDLNKYSQPCEHCEVQGERDCSAIQLDSSMI